MKAPPQLLDQTATVATITAIVVRNALEDLHVQHVISDTQMRQLNPLIRDAVATALHALHHYEDSDVARGYIDHHCMYIPDYWEEPELLPAYVASWTGKRWRELDIDGAEELESG